MNKLKIGIMGCANIAVRTVIPTLQKHNDFDVVSVASRSESKAVKTATKFGCQAVIGYDALLADDSLDAIYMPLPTGLHEEWVLKSLDAGKHILIEKSLAMTHDSANIMVDYARKKNLLIMENFMFLYHSQHKTIAKMIADGEIGEIRSFRSAFGFPPLAEDNFRYNKSLGGGALLDAAAYTIRASQLFLGFELSVQGAHLERVNSDGVDIYGGAFLKNRAGEFSEVAFGFDNFYQCNYEIWGSKGKITANKAFTPKPDEMPKVIIERQGFRDEITLPADDHFVNILTEFHRCIQAGNFSKKYIEIVNQSRLLQEVSHASNVVVG